MPEAPFDLKDMLAAPLHFGQLVVQKADAGGFVLRHRDDESRNDLNTYRNAEDAIALAKFDDLGNYRALKTAPNLRHGWRMELATFEELRRALDYFYPGRLAMFAAWKRGTLHTTPLRETLHRQSGMYRLAAKISDAQINDLVANFCRSDGGCLRAILWKRDRTGAVASSKLPQEKFDPEHDQAATGPTQVGTSRCDVWPRRPQRAVPTADEIPGAIPLLCQEACNLLIAECRKVVKGE
jgi:hypothetical protein